MSSSNFDVVLVSAFGRAHWLAVEFARLDLKVAMVDISDQLGRWAPEDWGGPFGQFLYPGMSTSQQNRLNEDGEAYEVPEGFQLWLKNGPLDTRGTHSRELLERFGVSKEEQEFLENFETRKSNENERLLKKHVENSYQKNWFLNLCYQVASPVYRENHESYKNERPLPIFSKHLVPYLSRRGFERSLEWVADQGVSIYRNSKMRDLSFQANFIQGLEVEGEWSGALIGAQYVWCLTSEETSFVCEQIAQELFPRGVLKAEWYWTRYRVELKGDLAKDLPLHFFCIQDANLPWVHENLLSVIRTPLEGQFDIWLRLPITHRFQKTYIEEKATLIREQLMQRLPNVTAEIVDYPQEYTCEPSQLGPVRWPIFDQEEFVAHGVRPWINLHSDSAENWSLLDWTGTFIAQDKIMKTLTQWKTERDTKRAKMEQEEAHL